MIHIHDSAAAGFRNFHSSHSTALAPNHYNRVSVKETTTEHSPNTSGAYPHPQNAIFVMATDVVQKLWQFCGGKWCGGDYWRVLWWQLNWPQLLSAGAALQILVSVVLQHRLQCCS